MTRSLVIGGTMFIGRTLVEQLLARGDEVVVMHRSAGTPWGTRVAEIRCDRNDISLVRAVLERNPFDLVFDNVYDWERGTTAEMVAAAADAVRGPRLRRYVFTSTVGAYGGGLDLEEDNPLAPIDHPMPYCANKAESERVLFRLHREQGLPVATLRPSFIYGPNNPFQREAWFWDRIVAGRPVIVPGDGTGLMQFVHVRDVVMAALLAAESDRAVGQSYNLGCYPPLTHLQWLDLLGQAAEKPVHTVSIPRERIEAAGGSIVGPPLYFGEFLDLPPFTVRTERVREELGLQEIPLQEGLRATFEWYRTQRRPAPDFTWEDQLMADAPSV